MSSLDFLRSKYEVFDWRAAGAVLAMNYPNELQDIVAVMSSFQLYRSHILAAGGGKSQIATHLDTQFYARGWEHERKFNIDIRVDDRAIALPTHKVDCFRNSIALEVEWNNKTEFFDRDLNNFRILFELQIVSVGVIITRSSALQRLFVRLGKGNSYGNSTTHMDKLLTRIQGGGAGGCPVLAIGIQEEVYVEDP